MGTNSKGGHVYAMEAGENYDPSTVVHEWAWSGDPLLFPHYDFSRQYWAKHPGR